MKPRARAELPWVVPFMPTVAEHFFEGAALLRAEALSRRRRGTRTRWPIYIGSCAFSTPRQPLPFSLGPAPLARRRSPVARGVPTS